MSRVKLRQAEDEDVDALQQRLAEEFQHPADEYSPPFINIERPGNRTHLLVVWDDWQNLNQQDRSSLIMRAYEAAEGVEAATDVSVAMGLTEAEAERLGFAFEPLAAQAA